MFFGRFAVAFPICIIRCIACCKLEEISSSKTTLLRQAIFPEGFLNENSVAWSWQVYPEGHLVKIQEEAARSIVAKPCRAAEPVKQKYTKAAKYAKNHAVKADNGKKRKYRKRAQHITESWKKGVEDAVESWQIVPFMSAKGRPLRVSMVCSLVSVMLCA